MASPTHRSEQTGNPGLDRIQNNVRDLVRHVATLVSRAIRIETTSGLGQADIALANANRTLTAAEAACRFWSFTGTLTGDCLVTVPGATNATARDRWVTNATTGGFDVIIKADAGGATVSVSAGTQALRFNTAGVTALT